MFVTKYITTYNFIYLCIYFRLSHSKQNRYLKQLLGDSDDENLASSDSDEDWFPTQDPISAIDDFDSENEQEQPEDRQSEEAGDEEENETKSETGSEAKGEARGILIRIVYRL